MTLLRRPFGRIASMLPVLLLLSPVAASAQSGQKPVPKAPPPPDPLVRLNESMDALTKKVWPSVVQILVSSYGARAEGAPGDANVVVGRQRSTGSGFVIDPEGYILTNAHVVNGARRVQIVVPAGDADGTLATALAGRASLLSARIVGIATELDLALLKVDDMKLPALPLATYSDLRQGETVFAFGSPIGLRNSMTHGLVSAVARQVDPDSPLIYIQTDAPINPGNSGGPLVNIRGEVVGINTFIVSQSGGNEGLGFAIPSATARTAVRQLRQFGQLRRQEVGMSLQTITPTMAASLVLPRDYGVIVSDVWPGGPAEAAGLKVGDVLMSVDGEPADNLPTVVYNFRLRDSTESRAAGGDERREAADAERHAGGSAKRLRFRVGAGRSGEEPGSRTRHPRRRDRSAYRRVRYRVERSQRRHRRRAHGRRRGRCAAAAEGCRSPVEQPENLDAPGVARRPARSSHPVRRSLCKSSVRAD